MLGLAGWPVEEIWLAELLLPPQATPENIPKLFLANLTTSR